MLATGTTLYFSSLFKALRTTCALKVKMSTLTESAPVVESQIGQKRSLPESEEIDVDSKKPREEKFQRIKKRKYAILICYSGQGYLGLQRNPGMKTIEEDVLKAWHKVGIIDDASFSNARNFDFQRAARTDKGVSAVRQILSGKLPLDVDVEAVNQHLPEQIRMVDLKRATKGFNCKGNADARTYSYMMPSFALAPTEEETSVDYRITKEVLDRTNQVLSNYVGTHNYHNFTSKKSFADPSSNRYMMKLECEGPVMCEGMEFVTIYVKGQSFMLHQIRKMVGLAIAIVRGLTSESVISKAWAEEKLDIPVAPGLGLVLEEVHYDRYNQRYGMDGMHDPIEWSSVKAKLDDFKHKYILTSIVKTEKEEDSMKLWLETLPMHTFDIRSQHRQNVAIPDSEDLPDNDETKAADEADPSVAENHSDSEDKTKS